MKQVGLAYGERRLEVSVPDDTAVITPQSMAGSKDVRGMLRRALAEPVSGPPLREIVRPGQTVAIAICDVTRPQPRELMLGAVLEELDGLTDTANVVVIVATGTHRGTTADELQAMLGTELAGSLEIIDHDARDPSSLTWCGVHGRDVPVWLNTRWCEADVRITTGFVEPHFFAGFSGGPKMVAPGLAGLETVLTLHDASRIGDPQATWGVCEGNPVHDDVRAIAAAPGVDYAFDVVLNGDHQVVAAFGGEVLAMHAVAREFARRVAMAPVDQLFDVIVTTNSGYPLDQNLYQLVKGMSAAATIVRPGGLIIAAGECRDGFPEHGLFYELLSSAPDLGGLVATFGDGANARPDQWQVQVLARVLDKATVVVHNDFLTVDQLAGVHLGATADISASVESGLVNAGPEARACVLPEGPQTIPYLRTNLG
jgi:nickel-dependent lactate racemase